MCCVRQYSTVSIDCCHRRLCVLAPFRHRETMLFLSLPAFTQAAFVPRSFVLRVFSPWYQRYFWQDCCLLQSFSPPFAFTSLSVSLLECCHSVSRKAQSGPGTSHRQKLVNRGAAARTIQPSTNRTSLSPAQMVPSGSAPRSAPASSVRPPPATLLPPLPGHPLPTPWLPTADPLATWRKKR